MPDSEIEAAVRKRSEDEWPVGMIVCLAGALLFCGSLGHDFRTIWEVVGFSSLVLAGLVNGVKWLITQSRLDKQLREELRARESGHTNG